MDPRGGTSASNGPPTIRACLAPKRTHDHVEDMPLSLLDIVNQVLGAEMRVEWDEECLNLEVSNFDTW